MSQYPSYYITPIVNKEAQKELIQSGEAQKLAHTPTKAALSDETSSLSYDPLIK